MLKFLLLVILLLVIERNAQADVEVEAESLCSNIKRHEIENHLATKTPYRVVLNRDDKPLKYPGCHPVRLWSVIRHGTRNPSKKVIKSAQEDLDQLKQQIMKNHNTLLCTEELDRLRFWHFNVSTSEEKFLVVEGEDELIELAERIQNRFPTLLPDTYDSHLYYFKYTATQRTLKSAQSFATGLFGRHQIGGITYPEALHRDPVLRVSVI